MAELYSPETLWKNFKQGDQQAFSTLYRHFYASLYHYALKSVADRDSAQECVQELFVTLWNSRKRLGDVRRVKAYLFRSLRRIIGRQQARQQARVVLSEANTSWSFSSEDFLIQQEDETYQRDTLAEVLNGLSARQREAVYLKYYEDMSYPQIAEVLHINYQSAVNLVYQAFQKLKQQPVLRKLLTHYQWYPFLLLASLLA